MANYIATSAFERQTTERQEAIAKSTTRELAEQAAVRAPLNMLCEEVAARVAPAWVGSFTFGGAVPMYNKNTDAQVDASGMMASSRFMAICDSLLSPKNQMWHGLGPEEELLKGDRATRMWFYNTTRKLFKHRYAPVSNFSANNQGVFHSLGCFGNGVMWIDHFYDMLGRKLALRYKNIPFGDIYLRQNHQGLYNGATRIMRFTASEAFTAFPQMKGKWPATFQQALEKNSQRKWGFLQKVCPQDAYDPHRLDYRNKPFASYYVMQDTNTFISEGGYLSLPFAASRYYQGPNEQDGRGVAMDVLPSLKTLDQEKRLFLKTAHRVADPILLMLDDGLMNMDMKPGAPNPGGWSADGHPLVGTLPVGDTRITLEMMNEEKGLINDAFLVALFQIMTEKNGMTATEVIERVNEKGILIAPTLGRQEGEYFGPLIDRELVCLADMGLLDPMPPALREAGGSYQVLYNSPLSKAMRAQEASGFLRTIENVKEIVAITQDMSLLDPFAFDRALPDIAGIQGVPEPWMATAEEIAQKRDTRAKQQQQQMQVQAAPAAAALMKAQAVSQKTQAAP